VGAGGRTVEPQTNYFIGRLQQDFRNGGSGVGVMLTGVNRRLDEWSDGHLRRGAYAGGLDFRHRFADNGYELAGYAVRSHVQGDTAAMRRTQTSSVHNFQRPDDGIVLDPARTSLGGDAQQLRLGKISGATRFSTGYTRYSPGFEINDAGFLPRADQQSYSNWFAVLFNTPRHFYRRLQVNVNQWQSFTTRGALTNLGGNVNANGQLKNMWFVYSGIGIDQLGGSVDDRDTRGGPAVYRSPSTFGFFGVEGDSRKPWIPGLDFFGRQSDYGRTRYFEVGPELELRAASGFSMSLSPSYSRNHDDAQWKENVTTTDPATNASTTHYTFARLEQQTLSLRTRLNVTATPNLSLQLYAEPFITHGDYSNLREVGDPRSADYERRYVPFPQGGDPGGFNFKQLRSNTVVRWEYKPGSTIFLVWTQGRDRYDDDAPGRFDVGSDSRELFRLHPDNTFLLKASYWFSL